MKTLFFFVLIIASKWAIAQEQFINIRGSVVDSLQMPISFASIQIKNKPFAAIANGKGAFSMSVENNEIAPKDSIIVSCVGYHSRVLALGILSLTEQNTILLKQKIFTVDDIIIRPEISVDKLMEKIIDKIEVLYPKDGFEQRGLYKNSQQINGLYTGVFESILKIYSDGYNAKFSESKYQFLNSDLIRQETCRHSDYKQKHDFRGFALSIPSPMGLLYQKKEVIYRSFLQKKNLRKFKFEYEADLGNVYVVSFRPQKIALSKINHAFYPYDDMQFGGRIFISKEDLGIERIETTNANWSAEFRTTKDVTTNHVHKFVSTECMLVFTRFQTKYYLNYIESTHKYQDLGWGDEPSKDVITKDILAITSLINTKLTNDDLKRIYGNFRQHDEMKISQKSANCTYNKAVWRTKGGLNDFFNNKEIIQDLGGLDDLNAQFERNAGMPLVSESDTKKINLRYNASKLTTQ